MKLPLLCPIPRRTSARPGRPRAAERGVALVITLILLSVITFMAIAFLVLSRNDRGSVNVTTDQTLARLANDAALERAQIEAAAPILVSGNEFTGGFLVSTNYVNSFGFLPGSGAAYTSPTNVNYTYASGAPLTGNDALQNLANLLYDPRPPVFYTNRLKGGYDFRFYLDLNRDGYFEPTGQLVVTNALGQPIIGANGAYITDHFVGDPQWIGGLEFPDRPHGPNNKFLWRYAYVVVPANETLDVNYVHNYAKALNPNMASGSGDGFYRNQGVGTWEINLGAFLADLNTNVWLPPSALYTYFWNTNDYFQANRGVAFDDALSLLRYRYAGQRGSQASVRGLFGSPGVLGFDYDYVDGYSAGPPMVGTSWVRNTLDADVTRVNAPWAGANNTNHFFSPQDFFDPSKSSANFVGHLRLATTNTASSYDRYTFYRLLSQLGTDSAPDGDRLNLNYRNVDTRGKVMPNVATNFYPWEPIVFFTNAADRLLANAGYTFTTTNIQVYPTNFYTPSVHRLLQLAANIYDATTNRSLGVPSATNGFPSVFRPLFQTVKVGNLTEIFINGYEEVTNSVIVDNPPPMRDLNSTNDLQNLQRNDLVYGVPLIIGARKGLPNFNEFESMLGIQVTRKLEFIRKDTTVATGYPDETNQMFVVGISNVFGAEAWNSYRQPYPRNLQMNFGLTISAYLTNQLGRIVMLYNTNRPFMTNLYWAQVNPPGPGRWSGFNGGGSVNSTSFKLPIATNWWHLANSTFVEAGGPASEYFKTLQADSAAFEKVPSARFYVPQWWLNVRTKLYYALVDTEAHRIVDYVMLGAADAPFDVTATLAQNDSYSPAYGPTDPYNPNGNPGAMWATNRYNPKGGAVTASTVTYGVQNQIGASMGLVAADWAQTANPLPPGQVPEAAIASFRYNLNPANGKQGDLHLTNRFFAPYVPTRSIYYYTSWQANDPLVHYTVGDLYNLNALFDRPYDFNGDHRDLTVRNLRQVNNRYETWGGLNNPANNSSPTKSDLRFKDPLVTGSDDWDFPTNRFPNIGWLGRVHRGTPWQTVYLKAPGFNTADEFSQWQKWSGNGLVMTNVGQLKSSVVRTNDLYKDAYFSCPTNDWRTLDLFTTAFNENAGKSRMSINQKGLASWSALLGGVLTLTNTVADNEWKQLPAPRFSPLAVNPAGVYDPADTNNLPPLVRLVTAINDWRSTNAVGKVFHKLGDILAVPELTTASPFLNRTGDNLQNGISDAAYERIPQQVLGLLQCDSTPRFVIYSYGQTLKPAPQSIVTGGPYFGLCTNYQVTAESATRAVVRIEGAPAHPQAVIESYTVLPPD